jgi:hemerythrin superfamily protein
MDIFEMLKKDHREVKDLFESLLESDANGEDREELFQQLRQALELHSAIEEKYLYPALQEVEETRDMALESIEEHRIVKQLLEELEDLDPEDEQWNAKLKVLMENVEHHVEEEEKELFKKAQKVLSKDELKEMGERAQEEKEMGPEA